MRNRRQLIPLILCKVVALLQKKVFFNAVILLHFAGEEHAQAEQSIPKPRQRC